MALKRVLFLLAAACAAGSIALAGRAADPRPGIDWPSFRGIKAAGVAEGFPTPAAWNVPKGEGVRWKTAVDGLGHSSPIVLSDRVCITTAISGKKDAGLRTGL